MGKLIDCKDYWLCYECGFCYPKEALSKVYEFAPNYCLRCGAEFDTIQDFKDTKFEKP